MKKYGALEAGGTKMVLAVMDGEGTELQRKVMEEAEWKILPRAIDLIACGQIEVADGKVNIKEHME